jgi:hypothetical protein
MQRRSPQFVLTLSSLPLAGMILCASFAAPPAKKARTTVSGKVAPKKAADSPDPAVFQREILPLLDKYCMGCHSGNEASAGISLSKETEVSAILSHRDLWEKVSSNIESKHMPPKDMPQPTQAERARLIAYVQSALSKASCDVKDPGRVTARRLNKAEYENTIRDLLGVSVPGMTDDFPSDDVGYGFDSIGDVLTLSPLHMEKYLAAAGKISRAVIIAPEDRAEKVKANLGPRVIPGDKLTGVQGGQALDNVYQLGTEGSTGVTYDFPAPGLYRVKVVAYEDHFGPEFAKMAFQLEGRPVRTVEVSATKSKPGTYETTIEVTKPRPLKVEVAYLNNYKITPAENPDPKQQGDRNLYIESMEIQPLGNVTEAPTAPTQGALSEAQKRVIRVQPADNTEAAKNLATKKNLVAFLYRAYRRPATADELDRLVKLAARIRGQGSSFERGMQVAVQASLVSPSFLFRIERDADPNNPKAQRPLTDYELATRLSYFLWSSMPDDRLLTLAAAKKLHNPLTLQAEAKRMLRDPRASESLGDNFGAQWLQLRKINQVTPNRKVFPLFTEEMRAAMRTETTLYFQHVIGDDRSVLDFLDSNYTYLNEPLARLYGNTEVKGKEFRRVTLSGTQRGGVLTQASVLTVTSNPTRTSPVKRGRWVMENLLGSPIPMPPPGVATLPDDKKKGPLTGTLRQRMEQHRTDPACASCHARMDPIGFGLENYDAIGMWRKLDDGHDIDAAGVLPGGKAFSNPSELRLALKAKAPQFTRNLSEKLLTYALGRGIESSDRCNLDAIAANVAKKDYKFSALVTEIVNSEPFRYRRGDQPVAKVAVAAKAQERIHE